MSWKLVFALSIFGLAMGFATVYVVPEAREPLAWLGVLATSAVVLAKRAPGKYFLHGLCVGLVNSVWVTGAHLALFDLYAAGHAREIAMASQLGSPNVMIAALGPAAGLLSGVVLGIVAYVLSKFLVSSHSEFAGW